MKEAAAERNPRFRPEQSEEKHSHADPGVDTQIEARERERERRAGCPAHQETQRRRHVRARRRTKGTQPATPGHQCFTIALKPALSRPFLAASAFFRSV